jgi:hypothetical protein
MFEIVACCVYIKSFLCLNCLSISKDLVPQAVPTHNYMKVNCNSGVKGLQMTVKCCVLYPFEEKQVINVFDKIKDSLR